MWAALAVAAQVGVAAGTQPGAQAGSGAAAAASVPGVQAPVLPVASGVIRYPASFFAAAQPNTAADMIDRLPGFVFDEGADVRGLGGAAGNVLIDGLRSSSKSDDLNSILRRIPASQVEHIDLIRGGAAGIDMQGRSVLANVIRKGGASSTGLISYGQSWYSRDGRQRPNLRLEGTRRSGATSLEGSLLVAGFADDGAGPGRQVTRDASGVVTNRAEDNVRAGGGQITATGAYESPLAGGKLRLNAQLFGQNYISDERVQDEVDASNATLEHDHQNRETGELSAHYNRDFGRDTSTELQFLQQFQGEDYLSLFNQPREVDRFREQHTGSETVMRGVATWRGLPKWTFEGGAEGDYNFQVSHTRFAVNGAPQVLPAANVTVTELRGEAFGTATWQARKTLTLEFGLRVEASHIASTGDVALGKDLTYPKPRLLVTWSPNDQNQLRLRLEREVGQLNFGDFVASSSFSTGQISAGNPNLVPQQATVIEGAYERRFWTDGAAVLTLRHSELTDVLDRIPVTSASGVFDSVGNIGAGSKDELIATLTVPLKPFGIEGGRLKSETNWRGTSVKDLSTGKDRSISGVRPLEGSIEFTQDLPKRKLKYGAIFNYGWRERYYRLNQIETDRFTPNGQLCVEYKARPDLSLRAEVDDIGAGFDRDLRNYPGPRGPTAISDSEQRTLEFGPTLYLRARRSF